MPRVTIVGAGAFGAWTALALRRRRWDVTLIDQHGAGNARASSGGETRIIRSGYGALSIYARWARQSLPEWLALERRCGERLFVRTGAIFLGGDERWLDDTAATLETEGIPVERLTPGQATRRFPQLAFAADSAIVFEPEAGALFARRAVQALVRLLGADGVHVVTRRVDPFPLLRESRDDAVVFAAGAWLPGLFPELRDLIRPTRQEVFFFGPPAGDTRFAVPQLPAWVAFDEGIYGLPDLEHRGAKVAIDAHGPAVNPETLDRIVDEDAVARIRGLLRRRVPALADAPLLESRVCQYENTSDGHFLFDRLPGHDRAWIAGGGSGHGFKHGPAIGKYVADLIERGTEPDASFRIDARPVRQRSVY